MANIFTIKIGNPVLSNSPLLDGELGFHLTNNTLYIGSLNGTVPIGGAGAFVPWENADTDKTLTLGSLNLAKPLAIESGGTGVTDLDLSKYLTEVDWSEVGFTENNGNWSLSISNLTVDGEIAATQNWVKQQGFITSAPTIDLSNYYNKTEANDTFVNVSGDTMTGKLLLSETPNLYFKNDSNYSAGEIYCGSYNQLGLIAKGSSEKRELRINSQNSNSDNNSALELIINDSSFFKVYHSGWAGRMSIPRIDLTEGYMYFFPTGSSQEVARLGLYTNSKQFFIGIKDATTGYHECFQFDKLDNSISSNQYYNFYTTKNIIYSSSQPTGSNGMIWLKPA